MYNPTRFKSADQAAAFDLMVQYPFATLVTVVDGQPRISHLPVIAKKVNDEIELIGHLARANPHWKYFANHPTTVVFQGSHTYVTPKWYINNNVPTWNYSVAHVKGDFELIENYDGVVDCLKELVSQVEKAWPSGWAFYLPEDLSGDRLLKGIVGYRVRVKEIDFKRKLHQAAKPEDRAGVLKGLAKREDDNSHGVLTDMRKLYSENGEFK